MRTESHPITADASGEATTLLVEAFRQALRAGHPAVGTEHLLAALLRGDAAAKELLVPGGRGAEELLAVVAKDAARWGSEDGTDDVVFADHFAVGALLREVEWSAWQRKTDVAGESRSDELRPQATSALVAAIGRALLGAHELGVARAGATHLLLGLLHDPANRAGEALRERGLDPGGIRTGLTDHPSARQDGPWHGDSVTGLRHLGMLTERGPYWGGLARSLSSGGFGTPMVLTVRREAMRQAVRFGHPQVTTAHLVLAMLVVDEQIATSGQRLRKRFAVDNAGAELLRDRGVARAAAAGAVADLAPSGERSRPTDPSLASGVEGVLHRAREIASERGAKATGTNHLLIALLAADDDPGTALLSTLGVDVGELRDALGC
ncbi:Clp protease N-terminal domain-containing protein [Saccharopolyspora sp. CA-218241]|uniref:Clp protease N-terminal domain-containing protein n=1 Tax=Saccharopolyspora sp. CA-218241 TaxID=3240027 RepID=UPI003D95F07C